MRSTAFIYVTHDQTEAMTLGDRIVIMKDGFVQQVGTPQEVFDHPANLFVAGFIGTPQMNFFDAKLTQEGGKYFVSAGGCKVELSPEKQAALSAKNVPTLDLGGARSFSAGDRLNLSFSGNVCHVFGQDGRNLEF